MQYFDGREYLDNETLPDLGSIQCISTTGGGIREYRGHSKDFDKLKAYVQKVNLLTGCFIIFEDTGETYEYFAIDRSWNKVPTKSGITSPGETSDDDIDFNDEWGSPNTGSVEDDITDDPDINFNDEWNG